MSASKTSLQREQDRYAPDMPRALAQHAVAYADALLAELERPRG